MGAAEGIPAVLTVVALVLLLALFPLYMFILFGHSWEFYVVLVFTVLSTISGLAYFMNFAWMTASQAQFLDQYLNNHADKGGEAKRTPAGDVQLTSDPSTI